MTRSVSFEGKKKPSRLAAVGRMKQIMTEYYIEAKTAADHHRKVAWITSGGPVEPLIAANVIPVYPENHGAMIGAAKMGVDLCQTAEQMGYAGELCSYARADIACATVDGGPIGGLPRPDMLVCCNNICGTVLKWYEVQARYFNVPLFILDTPMCHDGYTAEVRRYVGRQVQDYLGFIEAHSGRSLDRDRLADVGRLSLQGQQLWQDVLDTCTHKPAPMSAFDAFFHLALIVTLRGTETVVHYYTELLAELNQRIDQGIGAVAQEDYRLLWDNLPIWFKTRWLSEAFAAHNACLVADTYTSAWCRAARYIDPDDFINSMAEAYTRIYLNIGVDQMAAVVIDMIDRYDVHGLVMHSNRSCKPYSFGQYDILRQVRQARDIPTLVIEADMVDARNFADQPVQTRIDAFMELLHSR